MAILKRTINRGRIANCHTSASRNKTKSMSIRPEVLYGSDFETNPPRDGEVNVWLWSIVRASDLKCVVGETIEEWYEEVMRLSGIVCFHNLKFDYNFIMSWLIANNKEFSIEKTIIDADMHIPYRIALKDDLFIQDTMRVHAGKLEKVAKSYGLEGKMNSPDFSKFHEYGQATNEEIEYVLQDSTIVANILRLDCIENNGYIPLTGAGFAKIKYVNWLKESGLVEVEQRRKSKSNRADELLNQLFPFTQETEGGIEWQDLARQSYMGGLCLVKSGYEGKVNGKTYVYDVNSAYPFQMATMPIPVGKGKPVRSYQKGQFGIYYLKNCYFRHEDTCPIIHKSRVIGNKHRPTREVYEDVLLHIYGESDYIDGYEGDIVLTSIEIEYLLEYANFDFGEVAEGYVFDTRTDVFKDYIEGVYTTRQAIKKENPVKAEFLKLMMNSLYGKFGSASKYGCDMVIKEDGTYTEVIDKTDVDQPWCYVPVATAITGYERVYIATIISKNWDGFIYTDTDSIHLCKPHKDGSMRIHQKELGSLKCESIADESKYLRPKCYAHINEREYDNEGNETGCKPIVVKCGGMPEDVKKQIVSLDQLEIGAVFEGKLMPKKYKGGVYLQPCNFTIKTKDGY